MLAADGVDERDIEAVRQALERGGAVVEVLAAKAGEIQAQSGGPVPVDRAMNTMASVLYDAVAVPGGYDGVHALEQDGLARHYVAEAF